MTSTNEIYNKPFTTIYVAKPDYLAELCEELGQINGVIQDLVFANQHRPDICFAMDIWINPKIVTFESISEASKILQREGKFWYLHPVENVRRSHLIADNLRKPPNLT